MIMILNEYTLNLKCTEMMKSDIRVRKKKKKPRTYHLILCVHS